MTWSAPEGSPPTLSQWAGGFNAGTSEGHTLDHSSGQSSRPAPPVGLGTWLYLIPAPVRDGRASPWERRVCAYLWEEHLAHVREDGATTRSGGASRVPHFPAPTNRRFVRGTYPGGHVLAGERGQKPRRQVLSEPVSPWGGGGREP